MVKRLGAVGQRHLVDAAMAGHAADALGDVDVVAEEHIVRQLRDAGPLDRLVVGKAFRTGSSIDALVQICEWQVMQVCGRRQPGARRCLPPTLWQ